MNMMKNSHYEERKELRDFRSDDRIHSGFLYRIHSVFYLAKAAAVMYISIGNRALTGCRGFGTYKKTEDSGMEIICLQRF